MTPPVLNAGYLRMPSIRGDTVVFVSEDDLWTVPASGGLARRLTAGLGAVARPEISPDGTLVAFTGTEEHHPEVFCMPAEGGPARRLTYLGASSAVRGWTPDGKIVFCSDASQPMRRLPALYAIPPDGGHHTPLPVGPGHEVAFSPEGGVVVGRNTVDPARWKRYRGGTKGELWIDPRGRGRFRRLVDLDGNLASPMWLGRRVWFLSDHEGVGNLYSCLTDGRDLRRHTDHDAYYARFASTDGRRIVYQHAAELWLFEPDTAAARRIDVDYRSPRVQRNRKFVSPGRHLQHFAVHPDGHSIAIEARGKPFTMPLWEQAVRQYGAPDGVRYRLVQWLHDGTRVVVVSDEPDEETLEVHDGGAVKRLDGVALGRAVEMQASPRGGLVAIANHRLELVLVDVDAGESRVIDRSEHAGITDVTWSPDGAWLAYSFAATVQTRSIKLCRVADGATFLVTAPQFRDHGPAFDPDGRYLYFLSFRTFDPVYDSLYFDLGFPRASRPYLVTLRSEDRSPFEPKPRGFAGNGNAKGGGGKDGGAAEPLRIDLDGIERRVVAFPVPEGRYGKVRGIKGKVLFTASPVAGALPRTQPNANGDESRDRLEVYDLVELRHDVLVQGVTDFEVSRDGATLVYRTGQRLRAIKAGDKPDPALEKEPPGRRSGWIALERVRISVEPGLEWRQMVAEAWRLQRDHFWVEDMSQVDWTRVRERYLPLVDKVGTRGELSDLMWEMQGELGTSHAYEMGGDYRVPPQYAIGHLGVDLEYHARRRRYTIAHIVRGDSWDPERDSPLGAPGVNVHEGDALLAVNGRPLSADTPLGSLLVNQAGTNVELTVAGPGGRNRRTVVVRTLRAETPARYREWVDRNVAWVHERSGGRVGYVHIPDMGAPGYAEFHRTYLSELEHEGLIVDVRSNGGGHVSQLLLEKLARKRIGWSVQRWGAPEPYPADSPAGPLVCVTDEQAGSDGDIFTHAFKLLGLGPVVGKRTWGGVIGIWMRHALVDGSFTSQPEFAYWFADVRWGVENYGTDPDYDVDVAPHDHVAGRDPQLEKALELALRALRQHRPLVPDLTERPSLALPALPARGSTAGDGGARARSRHRATRTSRPAR